MRTAQQSVRRHPVPCQVYPFSLGCYSSTTTTKKCAIFFPLSCVAVKAELRPNLFAVTTLAMAARRFRFLICAAFLLRSEPSLESRTCQLLSRALSFFLTVCGERVGEEFPCRSEWLRGFEVFTRREEASLWCDKK